MEIIQFNERQIPKTTYQTSSRGNQLFLEKVLTECPQSDRPIYLTDWLHDNNSGKIYGYGEASYFQCNFRPSYYVWTDNVVFADLVLKAQFDWLRKPDMNIQVMSHIQLDVCTGSPLNYMMDEERDITWTCLKLPAENMDQAMFMHRFLNPQRRNYKANTEHDYEVKRACTQQQHEKLLADHYVHAVSLLRHFKTPGEWDLNSVVLFEMFHVHRDWNKCRLYSVYIDRHLHVYDANVQPNNLDVVAFDIETVSAVYEDVPLGQRLSEAIFSASLIFNVHGKGRFIFTLLHLPMNATVDGPLPIAQEEEYAHCDQRIVRWYATERELLSAICDLLTLTFEKTFICLGYNSKYYDLAFILRRLVYFSMLPELQCVFYRNGQYCIGINMLHIDLMLITKQYFNLKSLKLSSVAEFFLKNENKVDFSAVKIRLVYKQLIDQQDVHARFVDGVSLSKLAHYNDVDSILCLSLWYHVDYNNFLQRISRTYFLPITLIGVYTTGKYVSLRIFQHMLCRGILWTSEQIGFSNYSDANNVILSHQDVLCRGVETTFPGGFNFKNRRDYYRTALAMDFVSFYPSIIQGFNVSPETTMMFRAQILHSMLIHMSDQQKQDVFANFWIIRYSSHKSSTLYPRCKTADNAHLDIEGIRFVTHTADHGSFFTNWHDFERFALQKPNDDRIVIIVKPHIKRGILSQMIEDRNTLRNVCKKRYGVVKKWVKQANKWFGSPFKVYLDGLHQDEYLVHRQAMYDRFHLDQTFDFDASLIAIIGDELVSVLPKFQLLNEQQMGQLSKTEAACYIEWVVSEDTFLSGAYSNLKLVNNSIYGLLGAKSGLMMAAQCANIVTFFGRRFLLESARFAQQFQCELILSDTDSLFLSTSESTPPDVAEQITQHILRINSSLLLETKIYEHVFIIRKKTYLAMCTEDYGEEMFCRGMTRNDKLMKILSYFYKEFVTNVDRDVYIKDVPAIMETYIYEYIYRQLEKDPKYVVYPLNLQPLETYKTNTPSRNMIVRILKNHPTFTFNRSEMVFDMFGQSYDSNILGLEFELENLDISRLNLYKFVSKIHKQLLNMIDLAIIRTNRKRGVWFCLGADAAEFKTMSIKAFLNVRERICNDKL
jgi:DNA polymerase elongation subunit (family B)